VHLAGAVLDELQDVQSPEQHGVHVQEVDGEDPGLGVQELPPGRSRPARRRVDTRGMQNLPHRGRRDCHAEFRQLAVDPAVSPQRILPRQPDNNASNAPDCRRTARPAPIACVVLLRGQLAVPGQQRRGRDGVDLGPAAAGQEPCQRGEPHPVGRLVPHPADVAAQHRVLVPEHQQFSILCQVLAEHQDGKPEYAPRQLVDNLHQHPASQPSPRHGCWQQWQVSHSIEYSSGTPFGLLPG
jgi:hypothetical protein